MNKYVSATQTPINEMYDSSDKKRDRKSILFVCAYRGARAQIAEHYCRKFAGERFNVFSASFEPGPLSGVAVEVMREEQCVLSGRGGKSIFDYYAENYQFDYIISLCQESGVEQCPIFRRSVNKLYGESSVHLCWDTGDFRTLSGDESERLAAARAIRDELAAKVKAFVASEYAPMIASLDKSIDTLKP